MRIIRLFLLCLALTGCHTHAGDSRDVKATILRYNQLLSDCYRNLNMNPMQEVATPEHATKLYSHMAALGEGGVRMDSHLKGMDFVEVSFPSPGEAVVRTRELWDFAHYGIEKGEKQYEEKAFPYNMTYRLNKASGYWLVASITAESERKGKEEAGSAESMQGRQ